MLPKSFDKFLLKDIIDYRPLESLSLPYSLRRPFGRFWDRSIGLVTLNTLRKLYANSDTVDHMYDGFSRFTACRT